jgi:hypothetical protein
MKEAVGLLCGQHFCCILGAVDALLAVLLSKLLLHAAL